MSNPFSPGNMRDAGRKLLSKEQAQKAKPASPFNSMPVDLPGTAYLQFSTYADDNCHCSDLEELDAGAWGERWRPLLVNGRHVADVQVQYGSGFQNGWTFTIRPPNGSPGVVTTALVAQDLEEIE